MPWYNALYHRPQDLLDKQNNLPKQDQLHCQLKKQPLTISLQQWQQQQQRQQQAATTKYQEQQQ